jgi:hypothetical protein
MSSFGKKTRSPGYDPGNQWLICQVCGFAVRSQDARLTWDNKIVCPEDFEHRHPQDFVRGRSDRQVPLGLKNPEPADEFIDNKICSTKSSVSTVAITGCAAPSIV